MPRHLTLVTGGTRGIGAATALRLAAEGHDLVLAHVADEGAAETTRRAVEELGARCLIVRGDVSTEVGVDDLFARAQAFGRLTGVVNNAGATLHLGPLAETPPDVVRRTVDLNLTGALLVARAAVRAMSTTYDGEGGVLVNVSSGAATLGSPGEYVQYAAAKAGVDAMTLGLAQEVAGGGVRVVGVAPGLVDTRIHLDAGDAGRPARMAPSIPLARAAEPEEIANAIIWLLGDQASYVTGTTLRVAGGR